MCNYFSWIYLGSVGVDSVILLGHGEWYMFLNGLYLSGRNLRSWSSMCIECIHTLEKYVIWDFSFALFCRNMLELARIASTLCAAVVQYATSLVDVVIAINMVATMVTWKSRLAIILHWFSLKKDRYLHFFMARW